jgi:D-beta-D-heptose 7-phosphate kinase/D-beta-D-heptose 1-phosphate adenosyltransferase
MQPKLLTWDTVSKIPRDNKFVVFTNGCFDLLHEGHLHLLREAKKMGHILVVGLNSDASVKKLKGESRPVDPELIRIEKLSALSEVDHILVFSEETPVKLIEALRPDVLVKGGDYSMDDIVGARLVKSYGGRVEVIPLLEGFSTTKIIENKK